MSRRETKKDHEYKMTAGKSDGRCQRPPCSSCQNSVEGLSLLLNVKELNNKKTSRKWLCEFSRPEYPWISFNSFTQLSWSYQSLFLAAINSGFLIHFCKISNYIFIVPKRADISGENTGACFMTGGRTAGKCWPCNFSLMSFMAIENSCWSIFPSLFRSDSVLKTKIK